MKNKSLIIASAVACMALLSCDKTDSYSGEGKFAIYADREDIQPTKTEIKDGTSVVWKQGDAISLFVDEGERGGYKFVSKNAESSSNTEFEGNFKADGASHTYWAVYPYDESNLCDGNSVTATLPSTQVAKAGSFGDDLFISVARSSTNHMEFFNVCGGIKFTVNCDDVREVVISNSDGKPMSGTMRIVMDVAGRPKAESISDGSPDLRVIAPFGETFIKGASYYAVIPPVTFSKGVTIKYMTTEGKESSPIALPSSTIDRSVFSRLPAIESLTDFTYSPYLTFVSAGESSVSLETYANLEYSYDGVKWEKVSGSPIGLTNHNPQFFLRGINSKIYCSSSNDNGTLYVSGDDVACYGSVMKLLDYREDVTTFSEKCFSRLFAGCKQLTHAPELPATKLTKGCYERMFRGCTSLVSAPELPATTLAESCYSNMFYGCTSLVSAPELPATELADSCYLEMFSFCSNLVSAPDLPATKLADYCYAEMFYSCKSLTTAPALPATMLAEYCYWLMFSFCNLTVAPALPATRLAKMCYANMFSHNYSLTRAPELPATELAASCYFRMFDYCESLSTAPELPATHLATMCYGAMFQNCRSLTTAPKLPATVLEKECYGGMFGGCESMTTAPELPATKLVESCYYCMFAMSGLTSAPKLPATELASGCYEKMFWGCQSLTTAPELPATMLAENCYNYMFNYCKSLTVAPELPAINLKEGCYANMFSQCYSLSTAPALPATMLAEDCYNYMFAKCESLTTAPKLPATKLELGCYYSMFKDCPNLKDVTALFIKTSNQNVTYSNALGGWLSGVSSTGTFHKNAAATWKNSGIIPDGWDVVLVTK